MIYIMTIKDFNLPIELPDNYQVMNLGDTKLKRDYITDLDSDNNIHYLNPVLNELTGFYYIWKNNNLGNKDYVGLNHYRRFLQLTTSTEILTDEQIKNIFNDGYSIITNFPCETELTLFQGLEDHIKSKNLYLSQNKLEEEFKKIHPNDWEIFDYTFYHQNIFHCCNLLIMTINEFEKFCEWLFPVIVPLCEWYYKIDPTDRLPGYIVERMSQVWINKRRKEDNTFKIYEECNIFFVEQEE